MEAPSPSLRALCAVQEFVARDEEGGGRAVREGSSLPRCPRRAPGSVGGRVLRPRPCERRAGPTRAALAPRTHARRARSASCRATAPRRGVRTPLPGLLPDAPDCRRSRSGAWSVHRSRRPSWTRRRYTPPAGVPPRRARRHAWSLLRFIVHLSRVNYRAQVDSGQASGGAAEKAAPPRRVLAGRSPVGGAVPRARASDLAQSSAVRPHREEVRQTGPARPREHDPLAVW